MADYSPLIFKGIREYVQGPGIIAQLGEYVSGLAPQKKVCVLIDASVVFLLDKIEPSLKQANIDFCIWEFDGNLFLNNVNALSEEIQCKHNPKVIIGVGGGKTIDMSKMIARRLAARNIIVATLASTDAAAEDEHGHISAESSKFNADLVMIDSEVIASAPVRFFVAGIGDAISKKYEMITSMLLGEKNFFGGERVFFIEPLADVLHDTLLKHGVEAKEMVSKNQTNPVVEKVITATVLLSTLIWENGGLAGAHSIANVLFNAGYGKKNLHGELVAFSVLLHTELEKERLPDGEAAMLDAFFAQLGLPRKISDLGVPVDDQAEVLKICTGIDQRFTKHNLNYGSERLFQAIHAIEKSQINPARRSDRKSSSSFYI
jgi:glycerol dehydrogenase